MRRTDVSQTTWMADKENPVQDNIERKSLEMQIINSNFTNNNAAENSMILTLTDAYLKGCNFEDNKSSTGTHGIQL
jgi:hypothetical protein